MMPATRVQLAVANDNGSYHYADRPDWKYAVGDGLAGWVIDHNTPIDIPNIADPSYLPPGLIPEPGRGVRIGLPLGGDEAIGAIIIEANRPGSFDETDSGLVHLVRLQTSSALQSVLFISELDGAEAIISSMAKAVEAKDPYTHGHAARVTAYGVLLAEAAGVSRYYRDLILYSGPLHDVGKIGVPDKVLGKPGRLTDDEFALIQKHPVVGDEIVAPLRSLRRLRAGIRNHHERFDGKGYPDKLAGQNIPLEARIMAIADTFDAMTSNRPYRNGMSFEKALGILTENQGPQWEPALIDAFAGISKEMIESTGRNAVQ